MSSARILLSTNLMSLFVYQAAKIQLVSRNMNIIKNSFSLFATDSQILNKFRNSQISRVSVSEPQADELIKAIRNTDYKRAASLVKSGVDVDGHTRNENTPLTDAAERGDTKGVEFLLKNLGANPSASCDCPHHKTALHYAAENGHAETVAMLLKYEADPNVLDSRKYTAIDVAKTKEVKELLRVRCRTGKEIAQDKMKLKLYLPR